MLALTPNLHSPPFQLGAEEHLSACTPACGAALSLNWMLVSGRVDVQSNVFLAVALAPVG